MQLEVSEEASPVGQSRGVFGQKAARPEWLVQNMRTDEVRGYEELHKGRTLPDLCVPLGPQCQHSTCPMAGVHSVLIGWVSNYSTKHIWGAYFYHLCNPHNSHMKLMASEWGGRKMCVCVYTPVQRGASEYLSKVDLCGLSHFWGIMDKWDITAYSLIFAYPENYFFLKKVLLSVNPI